MTDTLTIENLKFEIYCVYARMLRNRLRAHLEIDCTRSLRNRLCAVTTSYELRPV